MTLALLTHFMAFVGGFALGALLVGLLLLKLFLQRMHRS